MIRETSRFTKRVNQDIKLKSQVFFHFQTKKSRTNPSFIIMDEANNQQI